MNGGSSCLLCRKEIGQLDRLSESASMYNEHKALGQSRAFTFSIYEGRLYYSLNGDHTN